MPEANGDYDWQERIRRLEESVARNWEEHDRIFKSLATLRETSLETSQGISSLVGAIRDLIDRIPPENLR